MQINRTFWTRVKGKAENLVQSFSYARDSQAVKYADKYGGEVNQVLTVPDELEEVIGDAEVWSYLENSSPNTPAETVTEDAEFTVFVQEHSGEWSVKGQYATISPANTEAKKLIYDYPKVVVVKN